MSTQKQTAVTSYLDNLSPMQIVQDEKVSDKFIQLYNAIHGSKMGESIYHKEQFNFNKLLQENTELQQCSKLSLYGAFLDVAVNGLSLDNTSRPTCYIIPRSVKSGRKDDNNKDIYEKRATVNITGYGELLMRQRAGQINYADNPVVVYGEFVEEQVGPIKQQVWVGDKFKVSIDENGRKKVEYEACIPRKSNKIAAAFIRIVRNDGSVDYQWLLEDDINRLKRYSEKANSKWDSNQNRRVNGDANALYTAHNGQIDPGFLENKMIKHAFDAYPKVRTGEFTLLQTQEDKQEVNYNLDSKNEEVQTPEVVNDQEAFGNTPEPVAKTVTVEDETF